VAGPSSAEAIEPTKPRDEMDNEVHKPVRLGSGSDHGLALARYDLPEEPPRQLPKPARPAPAVRGGSVPRCCPRATNS
jgi:hypothetical protein